MKILGLIPARGGSQGIPGKNVKLLAGKPLIQYTIEVALKATLLTEVIVSTDDDEIAKISTSLGADVPFLRPKDLSSASSPSIDAVIHAVQVLADQGNHFDAVCLLQPTSPFRSTNLIDESIVRFNQLEVDSLISVRQVPHHYNPHWTFMERDEGLLEISTRDKSIIPRRQDLPKAYHRDGSIYLTKIKVIQYQKSLYGKKIGFIENKHGAFINIDTLSDWEKATKYINNYGC